MLLLHTIAILAATLLSVSALPFDSSLGLVERYPHMNTTIDDQGNVPGYPISYGIHTADGDSWFHWSTITIAYNDTLSFCNSTTGFYSFPLLGGDVSFGIYTGKTYDRGVFLVYVDGAYVGQGDAFDANEGDDGGPSQLLFSYQSDLQQHTVTVKNAPDSRTGPKGNWLSLDYVTVTS